MARARNTYWDRKEKGICTRCGREPATERRAICDVCAKYYDSVSAISRRKSKAKELPPSDPNWNKLGSLRKKWKDA